MQCLAVVVIHVTVCQACYISLLTIDYLVGVERFTVVRCADFLLHDVMVVDQ